MSVETNKATIRRWVDAAWNHGDFSSADAMYAPDYVIHDPTAPNLRGVEALKGFISSFRASMPDLRMDITNVVGEGDAVAWRFTVSGTNLGTLMGIPPTGKTIVVTGNLISRFENGKWAEDFSSWDLFGMLQQLGVVPALA